MTSAHAAEVDLESRLPFALLLASSFGSLHPRSMCALIISNRTFFPQIGQSTNPSSLPELPVIVVALDFRLDLDKDAADDSRSATGEEGAESFCFFRCGSGSGEGEGEGLDSLRCSTRASSRTSCLEFRQATTASSMARLGLTWLILAGFRHEGQSFLWDTYVLRHCIYLVYSEKKLPIVR